jgi:predicted permease
MSNSNRIGRLARSMDTLWQDLRLALRLMRRSPGFTATIVLALALGIGANAAIASVVNSLLLRPLPVADPHRLVTISSDSALARGYPAGFGWSFAMWEALQPHLGRFDGALAWTPARFDLATGGERQPVYGIFASGSYFATLGVTAIRGRTFTAADDRPGGGAHGPVAVISSRLWQRRFGGSDNAIGAALSVDGVPVTIVGVAPPEFSGVDVGRALDVAVPLATEPMIRRGRSGLRTVRLLVMLRLEVDQSLAAGSATLRGLQPELLGVNRDAMRTVKPEHLREPFTLVSAATGTSLPIWGPSGLRQTYLQPLLTILAVGLLVLLIACVNIASLLLARGTARRRELGVRLAVGASRGRLVRQLLVESFAFAGLGAVGGLIVARWTSGALVAQLSTPGDRVTLDLSFDWRILAFTAAVAIATALIFGTVTAFRTTQIAPMEVLKAQARGAAWHGGAARRGPTLSGSLATLQIALSVTLVIAAALLVRSFERLSSVPLGFDPDLVLVVNVDTSNARTDPSDRLRLYQEIVDTVGRVPGVARAGGSMWTPVDGGMRLGDSQTRVSFNFVTPGWLATYGITLEAGRDFAVRDVAEAAPVAIVNKAFVRALMPDRSVLGEPLPPPRLGRASQRTVVGVVDDVVFESQREGSPAMVYLPIAQSRGSGPNGMAEIAVAVRPAAGPPMQLARSVGAAVTSVDPGLCFTFTALTDYVQASVRQERLVAVLSGAFGALALAIAALGLYGVTSYTVNRRVTEIGIRRALGAQRANVLGLVLRQCLIVTSVGIGLGLAGAAAVTRTLGGMLFGLRPLDPLTFAGVAVLFAVAATLAASIPAYRATTVDPLVALRNE